MLVTTLEQSPPVFVQIEIESSLTPTVDSWTYQIRIISEIHRYPEIPAKLRKKWNYLHAYTQLIKSKTTKIKIWTDLGDARLMENGSFEVNFYGGERFEQKEGDEVGSYFDYAGKRRTIDGNYPNTTIEHHLAHANRQYESVKR